MSASVGSVALSKPCCVLDCGAKREKDGYCMPHYRLFKAGDGAAPATVPEPSKVAARRASAATLPSPAHSSGSNNSGSWWRRSSTLNPSSSSSSLGCLPSGAGCGASSAPSHPPTAALPSSDSLLSELRSSWNGAFKVVFKDLPRLAKRTTIQNEEDVLVEVGRVRRVLAPPASVPSPSSSSASSAAPSLAFPPTRPVPSRPTHAPHSSVSNMHSAGSWLYWRGVENERWSSSGKRGDVSMVARRMAEMEQEGERRWEERQRKENGSSGEFAPPSPAAAATAAASGAASTPSPRADAAAAGAEMRSTSPSSASPLLPSSSPEDEVDAWNAACNVLLGVASQLESASVFAAAREHLEEASREMHAGSDHQGVLEEVFTRSLGLRSRTFRVFQSIHQSMLLPALAHLHSVLYSRTPAGQLKDVRSAHGWVVSVWIGAAVYVTHQRWEQSLHPPSDPRHVEVRWTLRLSFDVGMEDLRAAFVRIEEIKFHSDATEEYKTQVTRVMTGNGYIV